MRLREPEGPREGGGWAQRGRGGARWAAQAARALKTEPVSSCSLELFEGSNEAWDTSRCGFPEGHSGCRGWGEGAEHV